METEEALKGGNKKRIMDSECMAERASFWASGRSGTREYRPINGVGRECWELKGLLEGRIESDGLYGWQQNAERSGITLCRASNGRFLVGMWGPRARRQMGDEGYRRGGREGEG